MMVEIRKTNFVNKGAELMLHAILQQVGKRYPDAEFAMLPEKNAPFKDRAKLGLYQKLKLRQQGNLQDLLGGLVSKKIRQRYGIVLDKEIDVALDAAGFAYSDQWGDTIAQDTAKSVKKWKKQGTKVIFLPQAFGPFKSPKIQEAMRVIADSADLIYARERISYEHLTGAVGERENIRLAPDFTNLIKGELPEGFDALNNRFCLVPNARMLDKTSPEEAAAYPAFMARCARLLYDAGAKPFILIHEGQKDRELARQIIELSGINLVIVCEEDPIRVKGIIGACSGMIGSRFHGLVSALSQGVPAIATGWSHKYAMLMEDYGFAAGLLSAASSAQQVEQTVALLSSEASCRSIANGVKNAALIQKERSVQMWDEVFGIIGSDVRR